MSSTASTTSRPATGVADASLRYVRLATAGYFGIAWTLYALGSQQARTARRAWPLLAACVVALAVVSSLGAAVPPSKNGAIVFDVYDERADAADLYTVDPSGGRQRPVVGSKADETAGSWSPDGKRLAFARILGDGRAAIYLADADGRNIRKLVGGDRWYMNPSWSPDGTRIAFYSDLDFPAPKSEDDPPPPFELYTIRTDRTDMRRLTRNRAFDVDATWSPDGRTLAFSSDRDARPGSSMNIYVIGADGSNARRVTRIGGRFEWNPRFSPDGRTIVYESASRDGRQTDIWTVGLNGHHARPILGGPRWETNPVWSPDGNLIAFTSDRHARRSGERLNASFELWVMDVRGRNLKRLTNDRFATVYPAWQPLPAS